MTINSRRKGKEAEKQIVRQLNHWHKEAGGDGTAFARNLQQTRDGGCDIICPEYLRMAIEVKRSERLELRAWWAQAVAQAGDDKTPVLIYRQSRMAWRVRLEQRLCLRCGTGTTELVDIDLEAFGRMLCRMMEAIA